MNAKEKKYDIYTYSGELLTPDTIIRIEEIEDDTYIIHSGGKVSKSVLSIDTLEWELPKNNFLRVHPKHLINEDYINKIYKENTNWLELNNGDKIPFSITLLENQGYFSKRTSFINRILNRLRSHKTKN
ncbi:MAG: LytTR family transcriptional regulator DNA-binding domain-containing protein [Salinivirgaceae bacterium]|jgi:DNA-binding LytR/AlgR family response regulator